MLAELSGLGTTSTIGKDDGINTPDVTPESSAKTCGHCQKIKKPPKGKKIAWRERNQNWMYVQKDAPDEEGPAESQDDDEPLPGAKTEPGEGPDEVTQNVDARMMSEHRQQPNDNGLFVSGDNGTNADTMSATGREDSGYLTPTSEERTTSAAHETQSQQVQALTAHEEAGALTKDGSVEGDEVADSSTPNDTTPAKDAQATQPPLLQAGQTPILQETFEVAGVDAESKKRKDNSELETPVPKRTRVEIDLTKDDDDALMAVKSEYRGTLELYGSLQTNTEDMEHKLEQVRRERRILAIEREDVQKAAQEAELERKIAMSKARGRNAVRVKEEAVTKIED